MDINDLFDGIAEAFRQYQAEMTEQKQASANPVHWTWGGNRS